MTEDTDARIERDLIAKVVHSGQWAQLTGAGVEVGHFLSTQYRTVLEYGLRHQRNYGSAPSAAAVLEHNPDFDLGELPSDSLAYLIDRFKNAVKYRRAVDTLRSLATQLEDPSALANIEGHFLSAAQEFAREVPGGKVSRFSHMPARVDRYRAQKDSGAPPGILFGIPYLDQEILGIQPHEFIVVAGWTGMGKSAFAQKTCFEAWLQGYTPLYISLEMEAEAIFRRIDAMAAQIRHRAIKERDLADHEQSRWEMWAERAERASNDMLVVDDLGRATIDNVYSEITRWKPDLCVIDYLTLLKLDGGGKKQGWELVSELTRDLKQISRSLGVPIMGIAQTNRDSGATARKTVSLDTIAYSTSISQDADLVLGLERDDEMVEENKMTIRIVKNRDGKLTSVDMYWDLATMTMRPWRHADEFSTKWEQVAQKVSTAE